MPLPFEMHAGDTIDNLAERMAAGQSQMYVPVIHSAGAVFGVLTLPRV